VLGKRKKEGREREKGRTQPILISHGKKKEEKEGETGKAEPTIHHSEKEK